MSSPTRATTERNHVLVPRLQTLTASAHLAARNLLQDRLRFGLSVVGVGLSLMLILFLFGLREGALQSAVIYLENAPGSVEVLPAGTRSTAAGSTQYLPQETSQRVAETPGVARVTPVLMTMGFAQLHERKEILKLVGYDASLGGGPWTLERGREPETDSEVVLDRVLANRHGLGPDDTLTIAGHEFLVVGLSNETSSWTGSYAFARKQAVEQLVLAPGAASFLLVTPQPGVSDSALVEQLGLIQGTNVLLKRQVMDNDRQIVAGIFDQVILVMVGAAFIVGALVMGMVIYTATTERQAEYGVIKAIGGRSGFLYQTVGTQALLAAGFGAVVGVAFVYAMAWLVTTLKPQFLVVIEPRAILLAVGAGFIMALLGAILPARTAARLAPAEVFRR
ncbi:MAG TPA: ABC transporter permease [Gemmatimonadales bacterium]|nr:ABC transporter permease [Gemmatimonadales bacterium]